MSERRHDRKRLGIALLAVAVLCLVRDAAADENAAAGSGSPVADEATMIEARRHFAAGVNLLDDPDGARYEEAYHAFHKAYALSKSPKVLGNIGFCALKLERDGEAIDSYTTYLRESKDVEPRERAQIERDLATLGASIATFKVKVRRAPGSYVLVDTRAQTRGAPVVNSYAIAGNEATLRLRPGRHSFKVKLTTPPAPNETAESTPFDVTIEPASQLAHDFSFPPPVVVAPTIVREPAKPSYAGPIVVGILGVAALGTGAVTGFLARSKTDDIESTCTNDVCPRTFDLSSERSDAKTFGTIADATLIGGGALVATALVWAILTPGAKRSPRTGMATWQPGFACTAQSCGATIGGAL